jgi:hypothetical protein
MLSKRIRRLAEPYGVLLLLLSLVCLYAWARTGTTQGTEPSAPAPYRVLEDTMETTIAIGVEAQIDKGQLRATLAKAANDHQHDSARDYLTLDHLWVEAYLVDKERRSTVPAGRLRRYVPHPGRDDDWLDRLLNLGGRKKDKFTITLEEARRSLK